MSIHDKIVETLKGFNWGNYRLDEVKQAEADDWAHALADEISAAIDDEPFHTIDVTETGWTLKHPLDCRDDLFNCPTNRLAAQLEGPPAPPGRYRVSLVEGLLAIGESVHSGAVESTGADA